MVHSPGRDPRTLRCYLFCFRNGRLSKIGSPPLSVPSTILLFISAHSPHSRCTMIQPITLVLSEKFLSRNSVSGLPGVPGSPLTRPDSLIVYLSGTPSTDVPVTPRSHRPYLSHGPALSSTSVQCSSRVSGRSGKRHLTLPSVPSQNSSPRCAGLERKFT